MNKVPGKIYATSTTSVVNHPTGQVVTKRIYYTGILLGICDIFFDRQGKFQYETCSTPESEV